MILIRTRPILISTWLLAAFPMLRTVIAWKDLWREEEEEGDHNEREVRIHEEEEGDWYDDEDSNTFEDLDDYEGLL